ncbi:xanthine dehydrogenase family protein subunit M [Rhodoferax sp.]|uniref:FAD binding domain-containing protein n=1 Tax=Rhodoferax sp. TaxID=50421 RepID=UPI001EB0E289|nr:xanthine dehydrogenase family protein subunit M [Rhodoferax sp.]MBT9505625.1 xanthine dehydrogenase family protein subunit M [Rhodoferax sp.]
MKAPSFDYVKPSTLSEVFSLLQEHGDTARIIAGGQTLLATLNMRLSEPKLLIDINGVRGLSGISVQENCVRIGAMTRHSEIEESHLIAAHMPLLAMTAPHVAHKAIRNKGTLGGSIAFADPAAEWPCCAVALDAVIVMASQRGLRRVNAGDFFQDLYTTDMASDELIVACEFPLQPSTTVCAFEELARRHGDYAIVGLAAVAQASGKTLSNLRLVFLGAGNIPVRARAVERALEGQPLGPELLVAARKALAGELAPAADLYNSAEMKLHLANVLLNRTLAKLTA